ncbi:MULTISPECIES: TniQ family protein [unclassified Novosphingobium]|jgi:hypothetical protein|uniref:TniQ family protein n=1 Tax=unclassified Novosphingobium TaxID=2644732 RepID=UPI000A82FB61|nr:hypothetical protein EDF59_1743 [Novosphingobium sp. ST904]
MGAARRIEAKTVLPVAPRPRPCELVSSWLGRTAAQYDLETPQLLDWLAPNGAMPRNRPDVTWQEDEAAQVITACRAEPADIRGLQLAEVWPRLVVNWLPAPGRGGRMRGNLDLNWCRQCLDEAHRSGGAYLDRETALPLNFCHRHCSWRHDFCDNCDPRHEPRFVYADPVEFVCADCGHAPRNPGKFAPRYAASETWQPDGVRFARLMAFERQLRRAILGQNAYLTGAGPVTSRQMLDVVGDLTWALLAPQIGTGSLINSFSRPHRHWVRDHRPCTFSPSFYCELSPVYRAWVLSAVQTLLAPRPPAGRSSVREEAGNQPRDLEWLLLWAFPTLQAMLISRSARWPRRLRERVARMAGHPELRHIDVAAELAKLDARCAREQAMPYMPWA